MVDSYFEIGNSHLVCQDYALHGIYENMQYGIVADGCSNAEHSELGAQILCHVARYYLTVYYHTGLFEECSAKVLSSTIGNSILKRADDLRKLYPITPAALQATLLIIIAIEKEIFIFMWGDGVIIERYTPPEHPDSPPLSLITKIDYSANAPFYLVSDLKKYKDFLLNDKGIAEPKRIIENYRDDEKVRDEVSLAFFLPFYSPYVSKNTNKGNMVSVSICSDGILSYKNENKNPVDFLKIVPELTQFKSKSGEFVKKRMAFFKKSIQKKQWTHFDDIATATIIME